MNINDLTPEMIDAITKAFENKLEVYYEPQELKDSYTECFGDMVYRTSGTFGFVNTVNDVLETFGVEKGFGDGMDWECFDLVCSDLCDALLDNVIARSL